MIEYQDFSLKIEPKREDGSYPVIVLSSPAGEGRSSFILPFDPDDVGEVLSDLQQTVRGSSETEFRDASAVVTRTPTQQIGDMLFTALFSGPVRSLFERSLGMIHGQQGGLRIKLHIDPEDPSLAPLASLPWEFLYRKETRDFLNLSSFTPILRYLDVQRPYTPFPLKPPLHILVVISSPSDYTQLDMAREREQIESTWAKQEGVEVEFMEEATILALQDRLMERPYHVLHYMGHGGFNQRTGQGVLIMEDEDGLGDPVDGSTLGVLLLDAPTLRLVFLNACDTAKVTREQGLDPFSGVAAAMVMAGLPAVVAMQFPISNKAAVTFAERFYPLLAHGYPVDAAVAGARRVIRISDPETMEWGTPVLFMRAPQGEIFNVADTHALQPVQNLDIELDAAALTVDPGNKVVLTATVHTDGLSTDLYEVSVDGIPPSWVSLPPSLSLKGEDEQSVPLTIHPPRVSQSQAGQYPFTVRVTSMRDVAQSAESQGTLTVNAYTGFLSDMHPRDLRPQQEARVTIENQGNVEDNFSLTWRDQANEVTFTPPQARLTIPPGERATATFHAEPQRRPLIGGETPLPFSVEIASSEGTAQTHSGTIVNKARFPTWVAPIFILLCIALVAIGAAIFGQMNKTRTDEAAATATATWLEQDDDNDKLINRDEIAWGTDPDVQDTDNDSLLDGAEVHGWTSNGQTFTTHPNNPDTDGDGIPDNTDSDPGSPPTLTPTPTQTPTPTLTPTPTDTPKIVAPIVQTFTAEPATFEQGAESTIRLSWKAVDAESVTIEGIGTVDAEGSRDVPAPIEDTVYVLTAKNAGGETQAQVHVKVAPAQKPDLVVDAIQLDNATIVSGAEPWTWLQYQVTNIGQKATSQTIYLRSWANGSPLSGYMFTEETLGPGESIWKKVAVGHNSTWPVGSYTVKVEVDYREEITESNEDNNFSDEISFEVVSSPQGVVEITFDKLPDGTPITSNRILGSTDFADKGVYLSGAPDSSYCSDAKVAAIRTPRDNINANYLSTASPGNIAACNTVPVGIEFIDPVKRVTLTFYGASVTYVMKAYDQQERLLATVEETAVSKGGSFEITYSSASANIKYVTFGYSRALTAVVKITYEQ